MSISLTETESVPRIDATTSTAAEPHNELATPSHTALVVLNDAQAKLATITTIEEAKWWHSELNAIQHFLRCQRSGLAMQNKAALFKFIVERRMGELLLAVPKVQGKRDERDGLLLTIKRSGLSPWAAYRWMGLAKMPEGELLAAAAACEEHGEELTSKLVHDVLVRRWADRHGDAETPAKEPVAGAKELSLAQAKRELEDLELLEPGDLAGLSDLESQTLTEFLRKAYECFCEDAARGKVASWGAELPPAKTVQEQWAKDPGEWKTETGWFPPYTVNRQYLRALTEEIIADLRAGNGDGYRGIPRRLNLAEKLKGGISSNFASNPLGGLLPFIEQLRERVFNDVENCLGRYVVIEATIHRAIERLEHLRAEIESRAPSSREGMFIPRGHSSNTTLPVATDGSEKAGDV